MSSVGPLAAFWFEPAVSVPGIANRSNLRRGETVVSIMERYYFHLFNDITCIDEEGLVLPNDAVAVQKGATIAREMAAESVRQGHLVLDHRVEVANEHGDAVGVIHFKDVVQVRESASV
jgi:hypothetical protein